MPRSSHSPAASAACDRHRVSWPCLALPAGGEHEAFVTADYNAEMIEHVERYPSVRDRALFVGDPGHIVPGTFGPGLPGMR